MTVWLDKENDHGDKTEDKKEKRNSEEGKGIHDNSEERGKENKSRDWKAEKRKEYWKNKTRGGKKTRYKRKIKSKKDTINHTRR